MSLKVFISYAKEDQPKALKLYETLHNANFNPWIDKHSLLPGQDWKLVIQKTIEESDIFLFCLSTIAVSKIGEVQAELNYAFQKDLKLPENLIFIIPILFDNCMIPFKLKKYHWLNYQSDSDGILLLKSLREYQSKFFNPFPPLNSKQTINEYKPLFESLNKSELESYLTKEFLIDQGNFVLRLLLCIALLKNVNLAANGSIPRNIEQIDEWLSKLVKNEEIDGTSMYTWALVKHDYFESRFRNSPPTSQSLLRNLRNCITPPEEFLVAQLKPSPIFLYKKKLT